ncbi:MAG: hypothetical protein DCO96_05400 [Fluviicola sp. XM-24bin1]|nr:MAG: hypothetical protein DCO96_05400 [Fluviicola sp. XM-24bin1]
MNAETQSWSTHLISLLYLVFIGVLFSWADRSNTLVLFILFGGSFLGYALLLYQKNVSFNYLIGVGVIAHLLAFFFIPYLSPDCYRFLWDGALTWSGKNPVDHLPQDIIQQDPYTTNSYFRELYSGLTDLSRRHYTCYPTVNQWYFVVANTFSNSVAVNLLVLKALIYLTQLVGLRYIIKILEHFKMDPKKAFILALNPLWLVETVGNLHFEGVMLSFFVIGLYFLIKEKWVLASLFLAFAIHVKLVPIVLLPFLFRYLGWAKSAVVYSITGVFIALLAIVYLRLDNYMNFLNSLELYFRAFEFNSSIYHHYLQYGKDIYGWLRTDIYGERMSRLGMYVILAVAFFGGKRDFKTMASYMTVGLVLYYLFATTVHPWYVLTILGLSVFTRFSFGIIWSGLIFMTYVAYGDWPKDTDTFFWMVQIEYAILLAVMLYELIWRKPVLRFAA